MNLGGQGGTFSVGQQSHEAGSHLLCRRALLVQQNGRQEVCIYIPSRCFVILYLHGCLDVRWPHDYVARCCQDHPVRCALVEENEFALHSHGVIAIEHVPRIGHLR
jgi:hypothetical protein